MLVWLSAWSVVQTVYGHMAQWIPLPLTVSCSSKIHIGFTFLVPAHPGSPGQRAVKRVCVCVCMCACACVCIAWSYALCNALIIITSVEAAHNAFCACACFSFRAAQADDIATDSSIPSPKKTKSLKTHTRNRASSERDESVTSCGEFWLCVWALLLFYFFIEIFQ